jgi:hypothetical protein
LIGHSGTAPAAQQLSHRQIGRHKALQKFIAFLSFISLTVIHIVSSQQQLSALPNRLN